MIPSKILIENLQGGNTDQKGILISIEGQLDETNVDNMAENIYKIIADNPKNLHLLLDFEKLSYLNSKALGFLTDWYTRITDAGGKIVIAKPAQNIMDILQAVGISKFIKCYPEITEAKNNLF